MQRSPDSNGGGGDENLSLIDNKESQFYKNPRALDLARCVDLSIEEFEEMNKKYPHVASHLHDMRVTIETQSELSVRIIEKLAKYKDVLTNNPSMLSNDPNNFDKSSNWLEYYAGHTDGILLLQKICKEQGIDAITDILRLMKMKEEMATMACLAGEYAQKDSGYKQKLEDNLKRTEQKYKGLIS